MPAARLALTAMVAATALWDYTLLARTPSWQPGIRYFLLVLGAASAILIVVGRRFRLALVPAVVALLVGTAAWGGVTATIPHSGPIPTSGPTSQSMGLNGEDSADSAVSTLLKNTTTKWAAATNGDMSAASLELASGKAVIAIGGWSGSDPSPTLAQFKAAVANGEIRYYVAGGRGGGPGGNAGGNSEIASWVAANYTATTVGNTTVYDLASSS